MARLLSEFLQETALSLKAFKEKGNKLPLKATIVGADMNPVKKNGDEVFSLQVDPPGVWIVCNKTNATRLAAKFGLDVDKWIGKKITVNAERTTFNNQDGFIFLPK